MLHHSFVEWRQVQLDLDIGIVQARFNARDPKFHFIGPELVWQSEDNSDVG